MIGSILGGIGDIANSITGAVTSAKNYQLQKAQFDYQKQLQQQIFQREDNATQRKAADLAKAGLSKTLAAGGGANAGAVVATQAPQMNMPEFGASGAMAGMQMDAELKAMQQRSNLVKQQLESEKENTKTLSANREKIKADAERTRMETAALAYDTFVASTKGVRKGDTSVFGQITGVPQILGDVLKRALGKDNISDGFARLLDRYLPGRN